MAKPTADEDAAERIGSAIDGQLVKIDRELAELADAQTRTADLTATRATLVAEKARIEGRRPPRGNGQPDRTPREDQ